MREGSFLLRCRAAARGETERDGRMAIVEELASLREADHRASRRRPTPRRSSRCASACWAKAGTLTGYLRQMGQIAKEERAAVGKTANEVRAAVEGALAARKEDWPHPSWPPPSTRAAVDVTLPGRAQQVWGTRHLINRITDEISEIFLGLGYTVATGPEVETDYYNFEALAARPTIPAAAWPTRSTCATFRRAGGRARR